MSNTSISNHEEFGTVRIIEQNGKNLLFAKDVCQSLEIKNHIDAIGRLDEDEKERVIIHDSMGRRQQGWAINESGLYHLIFISRSQQAKAFRRWVTNDVLPSIRKTGAYTLPKDVKDEKELRQIERMVHNWSEHMDTVLIKMLSKGE